MKRHTVQLPSGTNFVVVQFLCLIILIIGGELVLADWPDRILLGLGVVLGLWAILVMRRTRWHVVPTLEKHAKFIQVGPYRWMRHPMYSALLLIGLGCLAMEATPIRMLAWIILLIDLLLKIDYEEALLLDRFPAYRAYTREVKRLLPFVY